MGRLTLQAITLIDHVVHTYITGRCVYVMFIVVANVIFIVDKVIVAIYNTNLMFIKLRFLALYHVTISGKWINHRQM